jgi:hypothetical protein
MSGRSETTAWSWILPFALAVLIMISNFIIEGREDGNWRLPLSRRAKHA